VKSDHESSGLTHESKPFHKNTICQKSTGKHWGKHPPLPLHRSALAADHHQRMFKWLEPINKASATATVDPSVRPQQPVADPLESYPNMEAGRSSGDEDNTRPPRPQRARVITTLFRT
jgi:hypothetical protein